MARGNVRARGDAWEISAYAGIDPATGRKRRVYRTVRGDKRLAQRALTKLLAEVDGGSHAGPDTTFAQLLDQWFARKEPKFSPKTAQETRRNIDRWIAPPKPKAGGPDFDDLQARWHRSPGRLKVSRVTTATLDLWIDGMLEQLAPPTVRRIRGIARAALEQAVRWHWIVVNPAASTEPIEGDSAEIDPPATEDVVRLLRHLAIDEPEIFTLVRLAAVTGRRRGELCALRWTDIDFDAGTVLVARTLSDSARDGWVERPISKNRKKFPPIALDGATLELLKLHRLQSMERLLSVGIRMPSDAHVFVRIMARREGIAPWSPDGVSRRFARVRAKVGLDTVRLHDLRHYAATTMLDQGVALTTVSGRLGHGDGGRTTQAVYAHWVPATDRSAAELLGKLLDG